MGFLVPVFERGALRADLADALCKGPVFDAAGGAARFGDGQAGVGFPSPVKRQNALLAQKNKKLTKKTKKGVVLFCKRMYNYNTVKSGKQREKKNEKNI